MLAFVDFCFETVNEVVNDSCFETVDEAVDDSCFETLDEVVDGSCCETVEDVFTVDDMRDVSLLCSTVFVISI